MTPNASETAEEQGHFETPAERRHRIGSEADDYLREIESEWGIDPSDPPWPRPIPDPPQEELLTAIAEFWRRHPDLRFGQLIGLAADVYIDRVAAKNRKLASTMTAATVDDGHLLEGVRSLLERWSHQTTRSSEQPHRTA